MTAVTYDQHGEAYPEGLYRTDRCCEPLAALDRVGEAEVSTYHEQGFLAVAGALSGAEVAGALAGLAAAGTPGSGADLQYEGWAAGRVESASPEDRLDMIRKFMNFVDVDERLGAAARHPAILGVVSRLLGGEPRLFQDMALLKPPGVGREKPWHQDNAYFHMVPGTPIVGVWIALDEATVDNGCMRVIPGSHREGPARHARLRDLQICDADVPVPRAVAVPLAPGGALFFDGLLQHGTPANRTSSRRRAMQFHYTVDDVQQTSDEEHRATFGWVDGSEC